MRCRESHRTNWRRSLHRILKNHGIALYIAPRRHQYLRFAQTLGVRPKPTAARQHDLSLEAMFQQRLFLDRPETKGKHAWGDGEVVPPLVQEITFQVTRDLLISHLT